MDGPKLHETLLVIDGHCDSALDQVGKSYVRGEQKSRDLLARGTEGHIDLPRLLEGGVSGQFFALFTDDHYVRKAGPHTWELLEAMEGLFSRSSGLKLALCAADLESAKKARRVGAMLTLEGGEAIGESLDELRKFYSRGVRLMGLTWNRRNAIARGVGADGTGGLTDFGRLVVREMENLGMIVDVSHLSDEALDELLPFAKRPLVASHSNAKALCPHRRNLSDAQALRIAETGGLIGITFAGVFIDADPAKVTFSRVLDHLDHLVSVVGADHVGLGTDFDGFSPQYGTVMRDCSHLGELTQALLDRNYGEDDIRKIMGGNWLRVIRDVVG